MQFIDKIPVWGKHEDNTLEQAKTCASHADYFALMADGHLGYGVPIGGVIATEGRISPTAVGFDIACGNKAVRLDIPGAEVRKNIHGRMPNQCACVARCELACAHQDLHPNGQVEEPQRVGDVAARFADDV